MAFEDFVKYNANFDLLNKAVSNESKQKQLIDLLKGKYKSEFVNHNPNYAYLWNIRTYKALKETFCSAQMFGESLIAKESKCWASFYFASYYALYHAFLACVFLLPDEPLHNLSNITHSKLLNVFKNSFCVGKSQMADPEFCKIFSLLKYQREYYSYQMPPNHFIYDCEENIKPDIVLPSLLKTCYQIANLLSILIDSAFEKYHKKICKTPENFQFVWEHFCIVNCAKHPITNQYQMHYVDKVRLRETFEYPAPVALVIELEHFSDEFGLYDKSGFPTFADETEFSPSKFVYNAIS